MRRAGGIAAMLTFAAAIAGCGGGDGTSNARSSSTTTTRITSPSAVTSTTSPPVVPPTPITIPSKHDGVSADGSGCSPPAGDSLPAGIWFGDLKSVDVSGRRIGLDLNCFFTGDAANHAAAEDGSADVPVPNDFWIRNKVHKVYTLHAVQNVAVLKLANQGGGPLENAGNGLAVAAAMLSEFSGHWIGWVQIDAGQVVVIQQQFVP